MSASRRRRLSRLAGYFVALLLVSAPLAHAQTATEDPQEASTTQAPDDEGGGGPGGVQLPTLPESPSSRLRPGLFLGDEFRYGNMMLPLRVLSDIVAIPAGMALWEPHDWGAFSLVTLATGALMFPLNHPFDARIQRSIQRALGPDHFRVWTPVGDVLVNGALWAPMVGLLVWGLANNDIRAVQLVSLTVEAFAVTQAFHLTFKLLLGREGPRNGQGLGRIFGPSESFNLFPAGTPSGHTASLYAMMGVATAYLDNLPLTLALHAFGLLFAATIVMDDYHFLSDVIWGGAMGYAIGQWVVKHRAAKGGASAKKGGPLFMVMPMVTPKGGGVSAGFRF
ncbi:phosphatase PAP2 family protein [Archangium minus]|uniref:phosphatase PAP2 family protein n=1 Tax=Archangium minus TaxID=83450 RepID=UPI0037BF70EF